MVRDDANKIYAYGGISEEGPVYDDSFVELVFPFHAGNDVATFKTFTAPGRHLRRRAVDGLWRVQCSGFRRRGPFRRVQPIHLPARQVRHPRLFHAYDPAAAVSAPGPQTLSNMIVHYKSDRADEKANFLLGSPAAAARFTGYGYPVSVPPRHGCGSIAMSAVEIVPADRGMIRAVLEALREDDMLEMAACEVDLDKLPDAIMRHKVFAFCAYTHDGRADRGLGHDPPRKRGRGRICLWDRPLGRGTTSNAASDTPLRAPLFGPVRLSSRRCGGAGQAT